MSDEVRLVPEVQEGAPKTGKQRNSLPGGQEGRNRDAQARKVGERTPLQKLADARRILGVTALPLRDEEKPDKVVIADRVITVVFSVERWKPVRGGVKITHRGMRWLSFEFDECAQRWDKIVVLDTTEKLPEPMYCMSFVEAMEDQVSRQQHEAMCYRPGTPSYPMDGPMRFVPKQKRES